jgi:hypothetical protein
MSAICLSGRLTPWVAIGISTTVYLSTGAITLSVAGQWRSRVRELGVLLIDGHTDRRSAAMYAELETLVNILCDADAMRDQGRLSAVRHEAACWQAYDRLGPDHPRPVEEHTSI